MTHLHHAVSADASGSPVQGHPFDHALALAEVSNNLFEGVASAQYWNLVGAFGGMTAAVVLNAILRSARSAGDPVVLTVNFAAPMAMARFRVSTRLVRASRTTQHWLVELSQDDQTIATATAVLAVRRKTWGHNEITMPDGLPSAEITAPMDRGRGLPWFSQYDLRPIRSMGSTSDPQVHTHAWIRDQVPRAMDFPALAAVCDTMLPWMFRRRKQNVPVNTVSLSVYFHVAGTELAEVGTDHVYTRSYGQICHAGYKDSHSQVWSRHGKLLATTQQMMWVKE